MTISIIAKMFYWIALVDNTDGKMYHFLELEGFILLKGPYYSRQSTDSKQPLPKYQVFTELQQTNLNLYGNKKDPE